MFRFNFLLTIMIFSFLSCKKDDDSSTDSLTTTSDYYVDIEIDGKMYEFNNMNRNLESSEYFLSGLIHLPEPSLHNGFKIKFYFVDSVYHFDIKHELLSVESDFNPLAPGTNLRSVSFELWSDKHFGVNPRYVSYLPENDSTTFLNISEVKFRGEKTNNLNTPVQSYHLYDISGEFKLNFKDEYSPAELKGIEGQFKLYFNMPVY